MAAKTKFKGRSLTQSQSSTSSSDSQDSETQTKTFLFGSNKVLISFTISQVIAGIIFFLGIGFGAGAYWIFDVRVEKFKYEMLNSVKKEVLDEVFNYINSTSTVK
ncbi:MAG: hypothetical protein A3B90_02305 [Candidatus Magasanikbacteria bacterium RIFCSPHIGHO2_02_FULL_41_13]|uniref:Uncharacterized protein n=1 Tax=Candidatus Magasanikbacteria bacterium RIFCSPHIGHO2_02_FULL_41_13 TaxID=1798676 RepID=A0A1F6M3T3_9BACT|nr:MAG: hypothetical protein A3B90_02305 [Candidatus Magasanikbacteria bacterium RIFCSPHIGHO2_02_FULL_41_13]